MLHILLSPLTWGLLLTALLVFSFANWDPTVTVKIWPNLVVETKIPAIVVISFLIGFVPMWLLYRANRWQAKRRMGSLAAQARPATVDPDPVATPAEHPAPLPADDLARPPLQP